MKKNKIPKPTFITTYKERVKDSPLWKAKSIEELEILLSQKGKD